MALERARIPRILELVAEIGKLSGSEPATLQRMVDSAWCSITTKEDLENIGDPYTHYAPSRYGPFGVFINKQVLTTFNINHFPGSCACGVGNTIHVYGFKVQSLTDLTVDLMYEIAGYAGYTALMFSDIHKNPHVLQALKERNFKQVFSVVNKRSTNECMFFYKEIPRA